MYRENVGSSRIDDITPKRTYCHNVEADLPDFLRGWLRRGAHVFRGLRVRPDVTASFPRIEPFGLTLPDEDADAECNHARVAAEATRRPFSILHPTGRGEVGRFGYVEAHVEPGVIAVRECHHYFTWFLDHLEHRTADVQ